MKKEFITLGTVVNAHGIRGEVKVQPAGCVEPETVTAFRRMYIGGAAYDVKSARVHKSLVLLTLPGVEDMDAALALKGKEVTAARKDARLPAGAYFDEELLECTVLDAAAGEAVGRVTDVIAYPAHRVMEVQGEKTYLIPMVDKVFIQRIDVEAGEVFVHMMKGLEVT